MILVYAFEKYNKQARSGEITSSDWLTAPELGKFVAFSKATIVRAIEQPVARARDMYSPRVTG